LLFSAKAYICFCDVTGRSAAFSFLRELTDDGWIAHVLSCEVRRLFSLVRIAKLGATAAAIRADRSGRLSPLTFNSGGISAVPARLKFLPSPIPPLPPAEMLSTPALSSDWRMWSLIFAIWSRVGLLKKFSRAKLLAWTKSLRPCMPHHTL